MKLKVLLLAILTTTLFAHQKASAQLLPLVAEDGVTTLSNHFTVYVDCEIPGTALFGLDIDASNLCPYYHMEVTIHFGCYPSQNFEFQTHLQSLGWTVTGNEKIGWTGRMTVPGGDPGFSQLLNIPCGCPITFTVNAVPNTVDPLPDCGPNGIGVGRITLNQM